MPPSTTGTGSKPVIVGSGGSVPKKPVPDVAVPPRVVTLMVAPVTTPAGMIACIVRPSALTVNVAVVFPKRTLVASVKSLPVSVSTCPAEPLPGVKLVITGGGIMFNVVVEVVLPPAPRIVMVPLVLPGGTRSVILVEEFTTYSGTGTPPMLTLPINRKSVPVSVTVSPAPAVLGLSDTTRGAGNTPTTLAVVATPPHDCTVRLPVVATGNRTRIWVGEMISTFDAVMPPMRTTGRYNSPKVGVP